MRLLWISPRWPFPADSGAKKATYSLLKALPPAAVSMQKDLIIDLVCLYDELDDLLSFQEQWSLISPKGRCLFLKKDSLLWGSTAFSYIVESLRHPQWPFTVARCTSRINQKKFNSWIQGNQWTATVIDGLHAVAFIEKPLSPAWGRWIYRSHNVETELWRQLKSQEKGFLKAFIFGRELARCETLEKNVCQRSLVLTVSEDDAAKYKKMEMTNQAQSLPIGFPILNKPTALNEKAVSFQLLFVGRLDWHPNIEGLTWFLEKVWPSLGSRFKLQIVGSGQSDWLQKYLSPDISLDRNVPELTPYYDKAHLCLIPLFMGSGTRVKAIEAGAQGRTFISTRIGAEGLQFQPNMDYYQAESAEEWIQTIQQISIADLKIKAESLFAKTTLHYSEAALAKQFLRLI